MLRHALETEPGVNEGNTRGFDLSGSQLLLGDLHVQLGGGELLLDGLQDLPGSARLGNGAGAEQHQQRQEQHFCAGDQTIAGGVRGMDCESSVSERHRVFLHNERLEGAARGGVRATSLMVEFIDTGFYAGGA
ncbi:MAG: hypothetical protein ACREP7_08885, partial [Lysobacter sp.]